MNASAYIENGILCVVGTHDTGYGEIPFSCTAQVEGECPPDGFIDVGAQLPDNVEFALDQIQKTVMNNVSEKKMQLAVRDVVLRARVGDQNAIATIVETRKAAARSPQAQRMVALLQLFIKNNPATGRLNVGNEAIVQRQLVTTTQTALAAPSPLHYGASVAALIPGAKGNPIIVLANGPELDDTRVNMIIQAMPEPERAGFSTSKIGYCVMQARRIQSVRSGHAPISSISKMAGWELGE